MELNKEICLTFDYELYFYESGTLENCILTPVDELRQVFREHNIPAVFFIDVIYIKRLKEHCPLDALKVENQLKDLVKEGHRIELHLHPHWLDAEYRHGTWHFPDYNRYRLHSLSEEEITELFMEGTAYLEGLASQAEPGYKVKAFRAGGWCIQPFEKLKKGFSEAGILIDSSASPGVKGEGEAHFFDFTKVPKKDSYRFSEKVHERHPEGEFIEVPITNYKKSFLDKILYKKMEDRRTITWGDGRGIPFAGNTNPLLEKLKTKRVMYCLEIKNRDYILHLLKKDKRLRINFISHPKAISDESLRCIRDMKAAGCVFQTLDVQVSV